METKISILYQPLIRTKKQNNSLWCALCTIVLIIIIFSITVSIIKQKFNFTLLFEEN